MRNSALLAALLVAGCKQESCPDYGDPSKPIVVVVGQAKLVLVPGPNPETDQVTSAQFMTLATGDALDLRLPPQGGHVAYVGAAATNLNGCGVSFRTTLIDPMNGAFVQYEDRVVSTLVPSSVMAGYGQSDPAQTSDYNNLPLCPNFVTRAIVDQPYTLEVRVTDKSGRSATARVQGVVPRCNEESASRRAVCQCECQANYVLGACAKADAGAASDGGGDGGGGGGGDGGGP